MKNLDRVLTASEIRGLNINRDDVLGFEYIWENDVDNHYLNVNGERIASFTSSHISRKTYNKIKRMGFGFGWKAPQLTDEEKGIIQAHENGENAFAYSVMCGDPKRNKIVR